jgi:hypothetical protein
MCESLTLRPLICIKVIGNGLVLYGKDGHVQAVLVPWGNRNHPICCFGVDHKSVECLRELNDAALN